MQPSQLTVPWLEPGDAFPVVTEAWDASTPAPGLLAAGASLDSSTLQHSYVRGIFPWFSEGQPVLWWSPDPRMVLQVTNFRLHRSLRKALKGFISRATCTVRMNTAFSEVIQHCANSHRRGQTGTWIGPDMQAAYTQLHEQGMAHSVETWVDGELVGGLYCVSIGKAVFGESMFSLRTDASKIALCALVAFCRQHDIRQIDCQQNTAHLASLGAAEIGRESFIEEVRLAVQSSPPRWHFERLYWDLIMHPET